MVREKPVIKADRLNLFYLDDVSLLHLVLLAVQGDGVPVLPFLLERSRLGPNHLAVHVQHLEVLLLDLHDYPNGLRIDL